MFIRLLIILASFLWILSKSYSFCLIGCIWSESSQPGWDSRPSLASARRWRVSKSGVKQSVVVLMCPCMMIATLSPAWHWSPVVPCYLRCCLSTQFTQGGSFYWYLLELPKRKGILSMPNLIVSTSSVPDIWIVRKYVNGAYEAQPRLLTGISSLAFLR